MDYYCFIKIEFYPIKKLRFKLVKLFFDLFRKKQEIKKIPPSFTKKDGKELENKPKVSPTKEKITELNDIKRSDDTKQADVDSHYFRDKFSSDISKKNNKNDNNNTSDEKESFGFG